MPKKTIEEQLESLATSVAKGFAGVDQQFAHVDERFKEMDTRFDKVETRLAGVETDLEVIKRTVTKIDEKLDVTSRLVASHERRIEALETKVN